VRTIPYPINCSVTENIMQIAGSKLFIKCTESFKIIVDINNGNILAVFNDILAKHALKGHIKITFPCAEIRLTVMLLCAQEPATNPILSDMNLLHTLSSNSFTIHFNINLSSTLMTSQ
jgi:hypothetical protein